MEGTALEDAWLARCGVDWTNPPDGMKWCVSPANDPAAGRPPFSPTLPDLTRGEVQIDEEATGDLLERSFVQIQAVRDIPEHGVKAGDLGGWIDVGLVRSSLPVCGPDRLLSDTGACWLGTGAYLTREGDDGVSSRYQSAPSISGNALVVGDTPDSLVILRSGAQVAGNATVTGAGTQVLGNGEVTDQATVRGVATVNGRVCGQALVEDNSQIGEWYYQESDLMPHPRYIPNPAEHELPWVGDHAWVSGSAAVRGHARVGGHAEVTGLARVFGEATVDGCALVCTTSNKNTLVGGQSHVGEDACVSGGYLTDHARVMGRGHVTESPYLGGNVTVEGDGVVAGKAICKGGVIRGTVNGQQDTVFASGVLPAGCEHTTGTFTVADAHRLAGQPMVGIGVAALLEDTPRGVLTAQLENAPRRFLTALFEDAPSGVVDAQPVSPQTGQQSPRCGNRGARSNAPCIRRKNHPGACRYR